MQPIEQIMKTGIELPCSDGGTRRYVPVLCQYIGDMEEQWLLTCTIKPTCPKCYHRGRKYVNDYGNEEEGGAEAVEEDGEDGEDEWTPPPEGTRRTDSDAVRDQDRYKDSDSNWIL
jgi:Plavaka transposase